MAIPNPGYVYVLLNLSMPNLVKVGKTSRDPTNRVAELSSATGVPTPFTLIYSSYFKNCAEAEAYIHAFLESQGYRLAANKEFFNAPVQEVIDAFLKAKDSLGTSLEEFGSESAAGQDFPRSQASDEPWRDLYDQAEAYFGGRGETMQNYKKALTLYKQAAKLGSIDALVALGGMYLRGDGCVKDHESALEYYEQAAAKGSDSTYRVMAEIFFERREYENGHKCWGKYFQSKWAKKELAEVDVMDYLDQVEKYGICDVSRGNLRYLVEFRKQILQSVERKQQITSRPAEYQREIRWIKDLFRESFGSGAMRGLETVSPDAEVQYPSGKEPWRRALARAEEHFSKERYKEALRLYQRAAELGSAYAFCYLGSMTSLGQGCTKDQELALDYYHKAARKGFDDGYIAMASIFFGEECYEKAQKCRKRYFESGTFVNAKQRREVNRLGSDTLRYLEAVWRYNQPIKHLPLLLEIKKEILEYVSDVPGRESNGTVQKPKNMFHLLSKDPARWLSKFQYETLVDRG